jgi:hypothetical protein
MSLDVEKNGIYSPFELFSFSAGLMGSAIEANEGVRSVKDEPSIDQDGQSEKGSKST